MFVNLYIDINEDSAYILYVCAFITLCLLIVMNNLANTGTLGGAYLGLAAQTTAFYDGMFNDIINTVNA